MKTNRRIVLGLLSLLLLATPGALLASGTPEAEKGKIVFGDASWDSIQVHNRIAGYILQHGYGYNVDYVAGETVPLVTGLMKGDIDVYMESWTENILELYRKGIDSGSFVDLGPNYPDSEQGFYVPTYMIKGDPGRGIEASAPDLKSVFDLPKYKDLFRDPEDPSKGRIMVGPPGWQVTKINQTKLKTYGLDKSFNGFLPGSDSALSGSMVAAYKKGEPWVGYYWAPTWVLGMLDMTLLDEPPYDEATYQKNYGTRMPPTHVNILANAKLVERAPDAIEFLKRYETTTPMNNEFLSVMRDQGLDVESTARWFLKNKSDVWTAWVPEDTAKQVMATLE